MDAGLVKGEGFAVDASIIKADASRQRGVPGDEQVNWSDNPDVYPSKQVLDTLFPLEPISLKMERVRTRLWSKIRTGS